MTSWNRFPSRNRDMQDGTERHVWGELEYVSGAGAVLKVRGTDTVDEEAPVLNTGYGMNYSKDTNTEVMLLSLGSDTDQKYAIVTIPRDKQRPWKEGTGGVQNPSDPDKALEFNAKRTWVTQDKFAIGQGIIEVDGDTVYIRGRLVVEQTATVNARVITPLVIPGSEAIAGFSE